jgi:hypothetical protein
MGVDWGRVDDYTCLSVIDLTTREQVALDRFNQIDWALQRGRLKALAERFRPQVILAEANSIGEPNIETLRAEGLPIQPFTTTAYSKKEIIDGLALAFEQDAISILSDPIQTGELLSFEQYKLPSGMLRYSAPRGGHDDTVLALALAWEAAGRPSAQGLVSFI